MLSASHPNCLCWKRLSNGTPTIVQWYANDLTEYLGKPLPYNMDIFETATDAVKYFKSGTSRLLYIPDAHCRAIPFGEHGLREALERLLDTLWNLTGFDSPS